ncbi:MAG: hypothetical protein HC912_09525 [Saprospiraceae bacterium]|nr:hypothetical protein [Saprospiraceae bacterium]
MGRHEDSLSAIELAGYRAKIHTILKGQPTTLKLLIESFTPKRQKKVLKVVEHLVAEGVIEQKDDTLNWKKGE